MKQTLPGHTDSFPPGPLLGNETELVSSAFTVECRSESIVLKVLVNSGYLCFWSKMMNESTTHRTYTFKPGIISIDALRYGIT